MIYILSRSSFGMKTPWCGLQDSVLGMRHVSARYHIAKLLGITHQFCEFQCLILFCDVLRIGLIGGATYSSSAYCYRSSYMSLSPFQLLLHVLVLSTIVHYFLLFILLLGENTKPQLHISKFRYIPLLACFTTPFALSTSAPESFYLPTSSLFSASSPFLLLATLPVSNTAGLGSTPSALSQPTFATLRLRFTTSPS